MRVTKTPSHEKSRKARKARKARKSFSAYSLVLLVFVCFVCFVCLDRKSTRLNSSHGYISYAVFCLKKKSIASCTEGVHSEPSALASPTLHVLTPRRRRPL